MIDEKQYDDAFTIQHVDEDLVEIFNTMAGMVPFIQKMIADKKAGIMLNAKMAHKVIEVNSKRRSRNLFNIATKYDFPFINIP